jgi:hypothetical protein
MIIDATGKNIDIVRAFQGTIVDPNKKDMIRYRLVLPGKRVEKTDIEVYDDAESIDRLQIHPKHLLLTVTGSFKDPVNGATLLSMSRNDRLVMSNRG